MLKCPHAIAILCLSCSCLTGSMVQAQTATPPAPVSSAAARMAAATSTTGIATPPQAITSAAARMAAATTTNAESTGAIAEQQVRNRVESWAGAWLTGDTTAYFKHYQTSFHGDAANRQSWEQQRADRLTRPDIDLSLTDVKVQVEGNRADVSFVQHYRSAQYHDQGTKHMTWVREGGQWQISRESFSAQK